MMHFKYDDLMILLSTCVDCSRNTRKKKKLKENACKNS